MKKSSCMKLWLCAVVVALTLSLSGCLFMPGGNGGTTDDEHDWKSEWEYDEQYHWHECNDCTETSGALPHTSSTWQKKDRGHYKICATCGAEYGFEAHTITDDTDTCSACGYVASGSQEIAYTLNGNAYTVTGLQSGASTQNLVIPSHYQGKPVTKIAERAFEGKTIDSVTIGCNITEVGYAAFVGTFNKVYYTGTIDDWCGIRFTGRDANPVYRAHNLTVDGVSVTEIAPNVVTIEGYAFIGCETLTTVNLQYVQMIGEETFFGCHGLTSVTLPARLINPKSGSFWYCKNLETVVIPDGVQSIGRNYFKSCAKLKTVTIGKDLRTIGSAAFEGCTALESVTFAEPSGWSKHGEAITGLDDPATAASLLRSETYESGYGWERA